MQAVYAILRSLLLYVYGLFAAFFMYAPGDTQQGQDLYSIIRAFLTDPCSIRNGLVGLLLLPSNVYLLGLVLTLAGLFYTGYTLVRMFGRIFMEAFATLAGAIRSVISSLRIGTWGRLGRRGYGGYRGYEGYGDYDDGYGFESQVPGFSSLIFGMSAVFCWSHPHCGQPGAIPGHLRRRHRLRKPAERNFYGGRLGLCPSR